MFDKIKPEPIATPRDVRYIHTMLSELIRGPLAKLISGHLRNKRSGLTELRQRHRHISLSTAEHRLELSGLAESMMSWRIETEHDFAKRNDSGHSAQIGQVKFAGKSDFGLREFGYQ